MLEPINRLLYVYYFMRGKSQLIKENIVDALVYFNRAKKYNKNDYPLYIYKGLSEFLVKDFENSMISYQFSLGVIDNNGKLTEDEKIYLKRYVIQNILHIFNILEDYTSYEEYASIYRNLKFDLINVRKYFLYDFPLEA